MPKSDKPLTIYDLVMTSPPEMCAHCGQEFPSAVLNSLNDHRPERVCVGCAFKAMNDRPFARLMRQVRRGVRDEDA